MAIYDADAAKLEYMLLHLLAVTHRDGGQYTAKHGLDKSVKDAIETIAAAVQREPLIDVEEGNDGPVSLPDGSVEQFTIKIGGKPYRCRCGCNVFHKPHKSRLMLYECNSCGSWSEGVD